MKADFALLGIPSKANAPDAPVTAAIARTYIDRGDGDYTCRACDKRIDAAAGMGPILEHLLQNHPQRAKTAAAAAAS